MYGETTKSNYSQFSSILGKMILILNRSGGHGMIVFSAKIAAKHQDTLKKKFPNQSFVFCTSIEEVREYITDAEILVTFGVDIDESLIKAANQLKWIHVLSAGVEELPLSRIEEKGIIVTNAKGIHAIQMSEYAISMLLQVYRREKVILKNEEKRIWNKSIRINEITGKTIAIVGTGAIGRELARLAKAFRMKTIGISRSGRTYEYFDENYPIKDLHHALQEADMVVSVVPSTKETKGLFTYHEFLQMKESAVFLNMGRGDAVVEEDLLQAIRSEEIAHAVLDVFQVEPLPEEHPFWKEENITITPHLSGLSPQYMNRALDIFERNLENYRNGSKELENTIDIKRGY